MAKDKTQDNTCDREWVWIGDYLDRKTIELRSSHLADRAVGEELDAGLLSVSYLDTNGKPSKDDLPAGFWRTAMADRETSAVVQPAISYDWTPILGNLPEGLTYGLTTPIRITNVKVLVPCAAVPAAPAPTVQKLAKNYEQDRVKAALKKRWPPDGLPPEGPTISMLLQILNAQLTKESGGLLTRPFRRDTLTRVLHAQRG